MTPLAAAAAAAAAFSEDAKLFVRVLVADPTGTGVATAFTYGDDGAAMIGCDTAGIVATGPGIDHSPQIATRPPRAAEDGTGRMPATSLELSACNASRQLPNTRCDDGLSAPFGLPCEPTLFLHVTRTALLVVEQS